MMWFFLMFLFAKEQEQAKDLGLISPIAEINSEENRLPKHSFTDVDGVESWFVQEKGFEAQKPQIVQQKKMQQRRPANIKSSQKRKKRR